MLQIEVSSFNITGEFFFINLIIFQHLRLWIGHSISSINWWQIPLRVLFISTILMLLHNLFIGKKERNIFFIFLIYHFFKERYMFVMCLALLDISNNCWRLEIMLPLQWFVEKLSSIRFFLYFGKELKKDWFPDRMISTVLGKSHVSYIPESQSLKQKKL